MRRGPAASAPDRHPRADGPRFAVVPSSSRPIQSASAPAWAAAAGSRTARCRRGPPGRRRPSARTRPGRRRCRGRRTRRRGPSAGGRSAGGGHVLEALAPGVAEHAVGHERVEVGVAGAEVEVEPAVVVEVAEVEPMRHHRVEPGLARHVGERAVAAVAVEAAALGARRSSRGSRRPRPPRRPGCSRRRRGRAGRRCRSPRTRPGSCRSAAATPAPGGDVGERLPPPGCRAVVAEQAVRRRRGTET